MLRIDSCIDILLCPLRLVSIWRLCQRRGQHRSPIPMPGRGRCRWATALPADTFTEEFVGLVQEKDVVIVDGETATGKSSRFPNALLYGVNEKNRPTKILVNQRRRIAVASLMWRLRKKRTDLEVMGYGVRRGLSQQRR